MSKKIREIIGEDREAYSVHLDVSIWQAIEYMREKKVGALAIRDDNGVVGVFSEQDVLRRVALEALNLAEVAVREVMSSPAYWISIDERCEVAKAIMVHKAFDHLVALDAEHTFRGFVSARELLEDDLADSKDLVGKLNDEYFLHGVDLTL